MGKKKVLVKVRMRERAREETDEIFARVQVHPEGKYVCDMDKSIDVTKLTPGTRVALRNDSYTLHVILPSEHRPARR